MTSINEARKALREGSVIIYPTDTVWGIGCDPFNQTSVNKLFKIKGKKEEGLSVLINNKKLISEYCLITSKHKNIIDKLFPGPVTVILKSKVKFAKGVTRNENLAIRIPNNKTAISLVEQHPIITTSANIHGMDVVKNIVEAKKIFGKSCTYLTGEEPSGIESTIIDLTEKYPKIVRIGALYGSTLEDIIGH
tara:strand:- start:3040 stop:3615 length:576 start_codon:yes stop_codon:yes gene_type:complete